MSDLGEQEGEPTRVAVFTAGFPPAALFGGPVRTLEALIDQQPEGFESLTIASDRDHGDSVRLPVTSNERIDRGPRSTYYVSTDSPRAFVRAFRVVRRFRPGVIYLNSFFNWHFSIMPQLAHAIGMFRGARLVIAPRGEFSRGALAIRSSKKNLYLRQFKLARLHRRILWHASSQDERREIERTIGPSAEIVVREDETHLPLRARPPRAKSGELLTVVFLSRLSEKKGLHTLLEALRYTREPVALSVFGFAEDPRYVECCEEVARTLPSHVTYSYGGPVDPDSVRDIFAKFDLFAFPTAGENFGHVIAESLSVSCPVMCADTTPWTRFIDRHSGGVLVPSLDPQEWASAIDSYTRSASDRMLKRRGAGAAYEVWRGEDKGQHVFELIRRYDLMG